MCLYLSKKKGYRSRALTVRYYRIAEGEVKAAEAVAREARVAEHRVVSVPHLREAGDLRGQNFPRLPKTYIPNRNMIFYALAASYAEETGANYIIGGHNAGDAEVFADTTPAFFSNLQRTLWSSSPILRGLRTTVLRPLQQMTKPKVVRRAFQLGVPLEMTWSCHRVGRRHCWKCEGCRGRISAFRVAGLEDPLIG